MLPVIFGESCTGKTTLAKALQAALGGRIFSGRDYLRPTRTEAEAEERFRALLCTARTGGE